MPVIAFACRITIVETHFFIGNVAALAHVVLGFLLILIRLIWLG